MDALITSDWKRIKQVLLNLLSNALKFTDVGKIKFGVEIQNSTLKFSVSDTGIGISDNDKMKLF